MTANITILVDRREDVLSVPNTALRYSPPAAALAQLAEAVSGDAPASEDSAGTPGRGTRGGGGQPDGVTGRGRGGGGRGGRGAPDGQAAPAAEAVPLIAGDKITFAAIPPEPPRPGRVWVMVPGGIPQQRDLMVGLTDGSRTEVISGDIEPGEFVLIGDSSQTEQGGGNNNSFTDPGRALQILGGGGGGRGGGGGGRGR
jgi:HlyD family secretion protein